MPKLKGQVLGTTRQTRETLLGNEGASGTASHVLVSGLFIPMSPDLGVFPRRCVMMTAIAYGLGPSQASCHLMPQRLWDQRRIQRHRAVKELAPNYTAQGMRALGPKLLTLKALRPLPGQEGRTGVAITTKRRAVPDPVMLGVRSWHLSSSLCGLPGG